MKSRALIFGGAAVVLFYVLSYFGWLPGLSRTASVVPEQITLSDGSDLGVVSIPIGNVAATPLPGSQPAAINKPAIRFNLYPWTAHHGFLFATGGLTTTKGSLMESAGVKVSITRQDDVEKMKAAQALFANALAGGQANPSEGVHFVTIMGDGAAAYIGSLNQMLAPLTEKDPNIRAEIIGAWGYSRGEDAFWGPQEWKDDPTKAKGKLASAYLRDGDWNLAQYWLAQNGIKNNPDETTFDPEALNWVSAPDFLTAVNQYVSNYCEERPIVKDGKVQSGKVQACVEAVGTWTPGDVNLAKNRGGLVHLMSTRENPYQMPATIIGIKAWNDANVRTLEALLDATFKGSDQVKSHDAALSKAAQIAFNVWGEQNAAYWKKYYLGVQERDKTGVPVRLGGSVVANLADNLFLFGLAEGAGGLNSSAYAASYTGFGRITQVQYPTLLPSFPPVDRVVNTSFIQALASKSGAKTDDAVLAEFNETGPEIARESIIAKRNWTINFATGSATFTPAARATLDELYTQLAIGGALAVQIDGHTDNVGNPGSNQVLSAARALAVKSYLEARNPALFPANRVITHGYGDTQPAADNATVAGKAANRRSSHAMPSHRQRQGAGSV